MQRVIPYLKRWVSRKHKKKDPVAFAHQLQTVPEFSTLEFHPLAGKIDKDKQYNFDGSVTVYPHGPENVHRIWELTKGAPEPKEISLFLEVIKKLPEDTLMMELGAGQALYSIILARRLPKAKLILVEANPRNLEVTTANMKLNQLANRSTIIHAAVSDKAGESVYVREAGCGSSVHPKGQYQVITVSVDDIMEKFSLSRVNIIHMDVQGAEEKVIEGMSKTLSRQLVDYLFIGTHTVDLHNACERALNNFEYKTLYSLDPSQNVNFDGILVCAKPQLE